MRLQVCPGKTPGKCSRICRKISWALFSIMFSYLNRFTKETICVNIQRTNKLQMVPVMASESSHTQSSCVHVFVSIAAVLTALWNTHLTTLSVVRLGRWVMYIITASGHWGLSMAQGMFGGYGAPQNSVGGSKFQKIASFETCWWGIRPIARDETSRMPRKVLPDFL